MHMCIVGVLTHGFSLSAGALLVPWLYPVSCGGVTCENECVGAQGHMAQYCEEADSQQK